MSNNFVLGTAFGYGVGQVRVFVESLRRHFDGDVALLVSSRTGPELVDYLRAHKVRPVFFDCAFWMSIDVQFGRYIRYAELLREAPRPYDRVMFSDVGDVLFQADPFGGLPPGELLLFLEDERTRIGESRANSLWIEQVYGSAMLERLRRERISCSGTTIGMHGAMLEYIEKLLWEGRPDIAARLNTYRGVDQGMHNVLLHTGALPQAVVVPNGDVVWTLHNVPDAEVFADAAGIRTPEGRHPPVVHQYPTKPVADRWVKARYP